MTTRDVLDGLRARAQPARRSVPAELIAGLVALVPRLGFMLHGAGLRGTYGYDPSVYYAASSALLHGRMPYGDYVLLHPPGIALALTPFAWFGELTTDHTGFIAANLAFTVLGAVNAALVVQVARRIGLDRRAALIGGLFYAVWFGAVGSEYLTRLEPLGNFFVLCGLLAYFTAQRTASRRAALLCGAAFGAAAAVKIWWIVPLLIVVAWHVHKSRRSRLAFVAGGSALSLLAICGPFFLAAPRQMWSMVVLDQLHRYRAGTAIHRLTGMSSVGQYAPRLSATMSVWVIVITALTLVALVIRAWRAPGSRIVVVLAVAQIAVLTSSPSWFPFYDDSMAPGLALMIAAAMPVRSASRSVHRIPRAVGAGVLACAIALAAVLDIYVPTPTVRPYPADALAPSVAHARCVMSDSPMALIELDVLDRGFDNGCQNWVDVTGRTYGQDAPTTFVNGRPAPRRDNVKWQRDLTAYLLSGDAFTFVRPPSATGIGPALRALLRREPLLAHSGAYKVFATHPLASGTGGLGAG